ncbi:MAG: hypothetical protein QXL17_00165 [Candidatus Thermoplasmatota archaeon]
MDETQQPESRGVFSLALKEYKTMETKLYGELMKTCRSYSNKLNIISIVGILDLVKQEMKDLDKTDFRFTKYGTSSDETDTL